MKPVNKQVLKESANKSMFTMEEKEYDTLLEEFNTLLKQIEIIGDIPGVDEVDPMSFPFEVSTSYLREDEVEEPLSSEEALKNASDVKDGQIRLPKVVG